MLGTREKISDIVSRKKKAKNYKEKLGRFLLMKKYKDKSIIAKESQRRNILVKKQSWNNH